MSDIVRKENRFGVEKDYVRVDIGQSVVEVPRYLVNPMTDRRHDLTKLSDDGYLKPFLAYRFARGSQDVIDVGSAPVLTFDKARWEYREQDGQIVLVKRDAETRFEELVLGDGQEEETHTAQ